MANIEVPPDPRRLIEGLRDTGYTFPTAIADIVDNSIAASARNIDIQVLMNLRGEISVNIFDDGLGMTREELVQGMKYGSPERPDPLSLGKFGLGLKTASTSYARRLSVISRSNTDGSATKATWDLDHVAKVSRWELIVEEPSKEEIQHLTRTTENGHGTVVMWSKVDRLLKEYADPAGKYARDALEKRVNELCPYIAMVYQRFLDPSDTRESHKIKLTVNGTRIQAWDPFYEGMSEKIAEEEYSVMLKGTDKSLGAFTVRGFVLPHRDDFDTPQEKERARISNDNQGIYIYRQNRLIEDATWFGLYSKEPHFSLARIEFSFGANLDEPLGVDIKKSKIRLSSEIEDWLKNDFVVPVRRAAEQRYRKNVDIKIGEEAKGAHDESNKNIKDKSNRIDMAGIESLDPEGNTAEVVNDHGRTRIPIEIRPSGKGKEVFVEPVDTIRDGLLWQPAIIGSNQGVEINTGHDFYRKVYVPNIVSSSASRFNIQGLDSLLWALAVAELRAVSDVTVQHFRDLRYEISKILRTLVMDMPEPPEPPEPGE